ARILVHTVFSTKDRRPLLRVGLTTVKETTDTTLSPDISHSDGNANTVPSRGARGCEISGLGLIPTPDTHPG
ncbi:MAG: hypothetical protein NTX51_18915, partial [Verrucomicrobia bacterium]|nr:hypothetical protein [Verrucomicrobiota bacterium]